MEWSVKEFQLDLTYLSEHLGLAPPTSSDGWSLSAPASFLSRELCRLRWWSNSNGLQALQIELATALLDSSVLEDWVEGVKVVLHKSLKGENALTPRLTQAWPLLPDGEVVKSGALSMWSRRGEWGKALVLSAGLVPCKQCGAPPGPSAKRCWECDFSPGLLGFLRR